MVRRVRTDKFSGAESAESPLGAFSSGSTSRCNLLSIYH